MKSWKTPTPEQVNRAVGLLGHAEQYRYFFDRLENPEWIEPLTSKGFFQTPPQVVRDEIRGTVRCPPWPASRYLARMASHKPEAVVDVLLGIPDIDNNSVIEDLTDAALNMPPDRSARLVEKAKSWARSPYQVRLPEKLSSLVAHLARGGQIEAALSLARVVLEILPDPREEARIEVENEYRLSPTPRARFDTWQYEQILKKDFLELVRAAGIQALDLLCDLLETGIRLSQRRGDYEGPEDLSYIWRRAIEDHAQNRLHTLRDVLVSGVRDAAELLAEGNKRNVPNLVRHLEGKLWWVFHRIALHLLRRFSDAAPDLVASHLLDRSVFDDMALRHEYVLLLAERFGNLTEAQQQTLLNWIDGGPSSDKLQWVREQVRVGQSADENVETYRKSWQCKRLAWLKRHLSGTWRERYEALVAELGEPEHPEFEVYIDSGWTGSTSPKSSADLRAMSVDDIIDFLSSWRAEKDPRSPSPEGLGRLLEAVVSEGPVPFAANAERFQGLDPTYVRFLISGFREAVKKNQSFDWPHVLDLCRWVVNQPREIPGRESEYADLDPGWVWTRKAIADLLSAGFEEGAGCIPIEHRHSVWQILHPLSDDPEPTPEYEARYGGSNMDPATLSINTTRGEAMHAVVRYALWMRRYLEKLPDAKQRLPRGFGEMPEVRAILDKHLNVSEDPSLAIRGVYGQWFPWLVLIDKAWAKSNVTRIFPTDDCQGMYRDAAWDTYIIFCTSYDEVFEVLRDQYAAAVQRLGARSSEQRHLADPDHRLAEHLMILYWRGKLDMDDRDALMMSFWHKAPTEIRGHALDFVGRSLDNFARTIPPEVLMRLKDLWESRLAAAKVAQIPGRHTAEMSAFGWWFVSGKFEDTWAIKQLDEALKIAGKVDHEEEVVERLTGLSQSMPREVVQCLEALVKGDKEGWNIYGWREHIRTILATALRGADLETRTIAENLVHYLGSRGYFQFRDLLQSVSLEDG